MTLSQQPGPKGETLLKSFEYAMAFCVSFFGPADDTLPPCFMCMSAIALGKMPRALRHDRDSPACNSPARLARDHVFELRYTILFYDFRVIEEAASSSGFMQAGC